MYTKTILVVDDEEAWREILGRVLLQSGYEVFFATSGEDALAFLERVKVSAVVLDLLMPKMDGQEVLDIIQQRHTQTPVIILSANQDEGKARDTLQKGAKDYVMKPLDVDHLLQSVMVACI